MARIRASSRGKTDAVAAAARDIDFRHLWRQLRAAGWTSKRPSGFSTDWSYVGPDGVQTFVGEDAVVVHAVESGLYKDIETDDAEAKDEYVADDDVEEAEGEGGEDVRPSQIDTSAQLSQGTLNDLFGSESESEADLLQAAVTRAFGVSPGELEAADSQREPASNMQLLSEVSGAESERVQEDAAAEGHGRMLRSRVLVKKDISFVPADENLSDYESFSSGESDGAEIEEEEGSNSAVASDDEDTVSEGDAVGLDEAFVESLQIGNGAMSKSATQRSAALRGMTWSPASGSFEEGVSSYPGLNMDEAQPVLELRSQCHSPLLTFFYFLPKSLWVTINIETNRYCQQRLDRRAKAVQAQQGHSHPETLTQIRRRLQAKAGYETHEILQVMGLLIARMLCPQKRSFAAHWSMTEDDNEADRARDKLCKLRPVVDKLQQRFLAGWSLPAVFSFDEGVLPSTSKRNTTLMFMPDKPHRYGSKMLMLCDSRTAYCHRFEMYAGKRNASDGGESSFVHKTGAAAVVRNMKTVLETKPRHPWQLVVVDRFYSSILLAIELLGMSVYVVETIMSDRLSFDKQVKETRKTRPETIPRGSFLFSRSAAVPSMVAFHWWDRKPVDFLCTDSALTISSIQRNVKRVGAETAPCPAAVNDYQRWMGGVDVHDQLRLQSYSLQTSTRFTKYYKSLFLGFVDLALVNAYISHKETARLSGTTAMPRGEWYCVLQSQLLQLKAEDFAGVVVTPPPNSQKRKRTPVRIGHALEQSEDLVTVSGVQKRRQRFCKVCALLRGNPKKKSFATTFYCERCSLDSAKCWLCNKIRHKYKGAAKTCFDIWHEDFDAGQSIPVTLGKKVVLR